MKISLEKLGFLKPSFSREIFICKQMFLKGSGRGLAISAEEPTFVGVNEFLETASR
jgi:hypothetical protein